MVRIPSHPPRTARSRSRAGRILPAAAVLAALAIGMYWMLAPPPGDELGPSQWRQLVNRFVAARATPAGASPPTTTASRGTPAAPVASGALPDREPSGLADRPEGSNAGALGETPSPTLAGGRAGGDRREGDRDRTTGVRLPREPLPAESLAEREIEYAAVRPKSVVALQRYRTATTARVVDALGRPGEARLTNLNPEVNAWYVLELSWEEGADESFHLVNVDSSRRDLTLLEDFAAGLAIIDSTGIDRCPLWDGGPASLARAAETDTPYVSLCGGAVMLRRPSTGRKSTMERVTDFLRDNVWGGERITVFVRETFFQDAFLETGEVTDVTASAAGPAAAAPPAARISPEYVGRGVRGEGLGLPVRGGHSGALPIGGWLPVAGSEGIWLSALEPRMLVPELLTGHRDVLAPLDEVEMQALSYMVGFDLARFELGFALGTDHPRLGWSERVPEERQDRSLPGPDGFDGPAPLINTGIVPASQVPRVAATFTGGFKRSHGAFRYGDLAMTNHGSHYGFIESGVILSKMQPGLATLYVTLDGTVGMKTWERADDRMLPTLRHARQNGVPILERTGIGVGAPTRMIARYGAGNWSGSQEGRYRTLRAGACIVEAPGRRYLLYGYFSGATPSAMAVVFQGYGCDYAMILDMNALEHTYLATYRLDGGSIAVSHLIEGMNVLDKEEEGQPRPRFLAFSDNRDFFYVLRRNPEDRP